MRKRLVLRRTASRKRATRRNWNATASAKGPERSTWCWPNPPCFSNYRIAEVFLKATRRALKPGGRTHFVTKQPKWYVEEFASVFEDVSVREGRGYFIVKGTQPEKKRRGSSKRTSSAPKNKTTKKTTRGNIPKSKTKSSKQARQNRPRKGE